MTEFLLWSFPRRWFQNLVVFFGKSPENPLAAALEVFLLKLHNKIMVVDQQAPGILLEILFAVLTKTTPAVGLQNLLEIFCYELLYRFI